MDEKKREEIRKQAKGILDNFSKALDKVKTGKKDFKKNVGGYREETNSFNNDADFRQRMFANASKKNEDCIIAETKSWN